MLLSEGFRVIISGVYAYPFDSTWLGAELTEEKIMRLAQLQEKYQINPSGEGGEIETFVLDGPSQLFQRIEILQASSTMPITGPVHLREDEVRRQMNDSVRMLLVDCCYERILSLNTSSSILLRALERLAFPPISHALWLTKSSWKAAIK